MADRSQRTYDAYSCAVGREHPIRVRDTHRKRSKDRLR